MILNSTRDNSIKQDYQRLFILGAVLGALIFILIYGTAILNPAYTQWIYYGDNDLKQHFMGWCHYRNSSWCFPIGLISTLSYPINISTIYTDSIPVIAFVCKLLSPVLPSDFQYFGLVGILFYALNGGTAAVLLKRFIKSSWISLLAAPLFIVSFPMIQRMYYHTALAAQWIIFICFIIWAFDTYEPKSFRPLIYWSFMGVLCVSIHSYFLPIAGMIMLADRISFYFFNKQLKIAKRLYYSALPIIGFCIGAVVTLWIFGGFYGSSSGVAPGLGTFGANFNTFINPGYYGAILPEMGYENYFQYEGCGYLGLGIILLSIYADAELLASWKNKKKINIISKEHIIILLGLFLVSFLSATLPKISWGTHNLGTVPYPNIIYRIASIFRSNGRFIWVGMYIIMLYSVVVSIYFLKERAKSGKHMLAYAVICIVLIIQTIDLSKMIKEKHEFFPRDDYSYTTIWENDPMLSRLTSGKKSFVFLYTENDINMETAFYAYRHNMTLNNFYFARDINDEVLDNINIYVGELSDGLVRDDTVYIMKKTDYELSKETLNELKVNLIELDDRVIFVADNGLKIK